MTVLDAAAFAEASAAENTRRAYAADWRAFQAWCEAEGLQALPAAPETLTAYLAAHAGRLRTSTLGRRLAGIRHAHLEADLAAPDSAELRKVWLGIRKSRGRPPTKKKALVLDLVRQVVASLPATPTGDRQRAMLLIGFAAALRRSELAALELDGPERGPVWLEHVAEGLVIRLDRSKGDQVGEGQQVVIPYGSSDLCPIAALERWLATARIRQGPVFRPIDRHGRIGAVALSPASVAREVKLCCARAGLNPRAFAGHSLRSGLITEAAARGVDLDTIMRTSRHAKVETVRGYIQDAERFTRNAAAGIGL